jgi:hypothetical protein
MNAYLHLVAGFFSRHSKDGKTSDTLFASGLLRHHSQFLDSDLPAQQTAANSETRWKLILINGAIGSAVGTALVALAEMLLAVANVFLMLTSPVIAPFVIMGWGASIGAVLGVAHAVAEQDEAGIPTDEEATRNEENEDTQGWLSRLIDDAIASGQSVLTVPADADQKYYP